VGMWGLTCWGGSVVGMWWLSLEDVVARFKGCGGSVVGNAVAQLLGCGGSVARDVVVQLWGCVGSVV
jgi:hypothetical protein